MSHPTCDRDYLRVPLAEYADIATPDVEAGDSTAADLAVFRAALLYVASDLRQLALSAPVNRSDQVVALSELVESLAAL